MDVLQIEQVCGFNGFHADLMAPATFKSTSSDPFERSCALFTMPSLMNHSCAGTASWTCFGDVIVVRATQALQPGDEVTIMYTASGSYLSRASSLQKHMEACDCWLCAQERLDGEERCRRRKDLLAAFDVAAPEQRTIASAREFLQAMQATYRADAGRAAVRPGLAVAYGVLGHELSLAALQKPSMYREVAETHMRGLEAIGIAVVDNSVRGRVPKAKAARLPIATVRAPIQSTHAPMVALMIGASFCKMGDGVRARRWLMASQWRE